MPSSRRGANEHCSADFHTSFTVANPACARAASRFGPVTDDTSKRYISVRLHSIGVPPDRLLETWEYNGAKHQYCDRWRGHSIFVSRDNPDYAGSLMFGEMLGAGLKTRGLQYTPHYVEPIMGHRRRILVDPQTGVYRYDQLIVLRKARMPAVLLEAGSIVHRDEELALQSPERQALISAAATEAVEKFCAARGKTLLQLAFGWLLSHDFIPSVIAGATKPEQIEQNVAAAGWTPSAADMAELDRLTKK